MDELERSAIELARAGQYDYRLPLTIIAVCLIVLAAAAALWMWRTWKRSRVDHF